jgi:hypothetical protein
VFLQSFSLSVFGVPTSNSVLLCVGTSSGSAVVRIGEVVGCRITPRNSGNIIAAAFASDFVASSPVGVPGALVTLSNAELFTFNVTFPTLTVPGDTGLVMVATGGANITSSPLLITVAGSPTVDSVLSCVGVNSRTAQVQAGETVNCTIFARSAPSQSTTALASDFATALTLNGLNVGPAQRAGNGSIFFFTVTAPAVGTPFTVTGRLASGANFTQGPVTIQVLGTPTSASTLACYSLRSGSTFVRVSEVTVCNITVRDDQGTTAGVAGDFGLPDVSVGASTSITVIQSTQNGLFMVFNVTSPSSRLTPFAVRGRTAALDVFTQGFFPLTMVGTPTADSTLQCLGYRSGTSFLRVDEVAQCTIRVRDALGTSTGTAADFSAIVTGGSSSLALTRAAGGSLVRFDVTAPNTVGAPFSVVGVVTDSGANFTSGPFPLTVVGTPTVHSTVSCVGARSQTTFVRVQELVVCTVTVNQGPGLPTTGVEEDFGVAIVVGGSDQTPISKIGAGLTMQFNVTASSVVGGEFFVVGVLANGSANFTQGSVPVTVVGTPTTTSRLSCVGLRSQTAFVRVSELVTCFVTVFRFGVATTAVPSDFQTPVVAGGSGTTAIASSAGGFVMQFNTTSPATVGEGFNVSVSLTDGSGAIAFSPFSLTVVGTPTVDSTIACVGVRSQTAFVRVNELVACVLTVNQAPGVATSGVTTDFLTPNVVGGRNVTAFVRGVGGNTMLFNVTAPDTVGAAFTVRGILTAGSAAFTQTPFAVTVVGTPTIDSTIACVNPRTSSTFTRVNETISCVITARDALGPTTAVTTDFLDSIVLGGSLSTPLVRALSGDTFSFNVTAPAVVGASFSVSGVLANGTAFSQGPFPLAVVGTPTVLSNITCVGLRSQTRFVRVSELVTCEIIAIGAGGLPTTSIVPDFEIDGIGGVAYSPLVRAGSPVGSRIAFNVTSPSAVGAPFSILIRITDTNAPFLQGPMVLVTG